MKPRRPDYVPADAVYVSSNRERLRHGDRRRVRLRHILLIVLGSIAVATMCVALARIEHVREQGARGWPQVTVTPTTYGPPPATTGRR